MSQGTKFDSGKTQLHLLPFPAMEEVGKVLSYGAAKYGPYNWRKGMAWSRLVAAALRHIFAYMRGERLNPEPAIYSVNDSSVLIHPATNYSHLAHAACDILMLLNYDLLNEGIDDLYDRPKEELG